MDLDLKDQIKKLVEKAVESDHGAEAMRYSQAANNVANTMSALNSLKD